LLIDLATAQQRAERWEDALTTWKGVLAGGSSPRRREAVGALLRIYERLNRPQPEAELLLAEFDTRADAKEQLETFKELLKLCERAGLLSWLHEQWAARREGRLDDATGEIAWAQLLRAEGDAEGAFTALSDALFTAPNPADALPELVRQAEELRRLDAAIDFQSRLVRLGSQGRPEALIKLAELQERDFAIEPAARTWALVVSRFPRDAGALAAAVEFHLRSGDRARAASLLRRVRELEPNDTRALFSLARLDLRDGELKEAEACLEQILHGTESTGAKPVRFPAMKQEEFARLQAAYLRGLEQRGTKPQAETMRALRGFWVEAVADNKTEDDLRLNAIRELAGLARAKEDPASLKQWVLRWRNLEDEDPSEVLWALYYANAGAATLDFVEGLMAKDPANEQYRQGYFWLGLQLREFRRLAAWMTVRRGSGDRRDFVYIALAQYLQMTPGWIDPELLRALIPPEAKGRVWEFAQLCATNMCYTEAVELGRRAYAAERQDRAARGWEIAQWELALGHSAEAQRLLAEVAKMPGEGFQAPAYTALRAAMLLLPPDERPASAERAEHAAAGAPPLHAAITRILVRALSGREAEARAEVRQLARRWVLPPLTADDYGELLAGKSITGRRAWNFVQEAGQQLRTWGLDSLAQAFWEEALADPALIRLQGDNVQETARDVRLQLLALQVAHAGRDEVAELLERSERGPQALEPGTGLGEALEQMRALPRAVEVWYRGWRHDPSNGQALRSLLNACRAADDTETAETALQAGVSQRLFSLNDNVHRDLVLQLADLLERRGAFLEARKTVAKAVESSPYDTRLILRLAQLTEQAGALADAEALWRRLLAADPNHAAGQLGLAELLARTGRRDAAIVLLQKGTSPGVETKLAELLYAAGRTDAAIGVVERVSGTDRLAAPQTLATAMLAKGDRLAARTMLQSAVARTSDPAAAMKLESLLIESLAAPAESTLIARELLKLRQLASDDPGRLGVYFSFVQTHAAALGILAPAQRELAAAWSEGTGLLQAGLVLLTWKLETAPGEAETVLNQVLARRDVGEPWLKSMLPPLETARRPDLAARVEQRLLRLTPGDFELLLSAVRHLDAAGRREDAVALMQGSGARAFIDESVARPAAQAWLALGQTEPARQLLGTIAPPRGVLRGYEPLLDHAQLRLAAGDFGPAKALLLRAFEHPGNHEYARVIEWLDAGGKLDRWETELGEFRFTATQMLGIKRAVFANYAARPDHAKVIALVEAHPELLDAPRLEALRAAAKRTGEFGEIAGVMERPLAQSTDPALSLNYVLTLADWAETEAPDAALAHLHAAQTRRPDVFLLCEKLHALHRARGEPAEAKAAVQRYLAAAAKDAPERAAAANLTQ
jgi:tetratricopeptide (TPR) repeat protein